MALGDLTELRLSSHACHRTLVNIAKQEADSMDDSRPGA